MFHVGNKVRLVKNYYDDTWYKKQPRHIRKEIAKIKDLLGTVRHVFVDNTADVSFANRQYTCVHVDMLQSDTKFHVGDRVHCDDYGYGTVRVVNEKYPAICFGVEFDESNGALHYLDGDIADRRGWWFMDDGTSLNRKITLAAPAERLTKRPAQVGEKVKIVNAFASAGCYKNGDVLTVEQSKPANRCVITTGTIVLHDTEYLVIEPDSPKDTTPAWQNYATPAWKKIRAKVLASAPHTYTPEQIAEAQRITYDELFKVWNGGGCQAIHFIELQPDDRAHQDDDDRRFKGKPRTLCTRIRSYSGAKLQRTYAFCAPNDEWTPEIGRMVAICKMTGRKMPEWL